MNLTNDFASYTKLNIACGPVNKFPEPWLNVDIKSDVAQLEIDVRELPEEWTGKFWEVRASHVMEHFFANEWELIIKEWLRVLKPGGVLRLAMPDLRIIVDNLFTENGRDLKGRPTLSLAEPTALLTQIYGIGYEKEDTEKRWRHRIVVDDKTVISYLDEMGEFSTVCRVNKHNDSAALHSINDDSQNSWSMTIAARKKGDDAQIELQTQYEFKVNEITEIPVNTDVSAVLALVFNELGQLLVVRNQRGWDIPGGHVEEGEAAEQALRREVLEEAYATIENPQLFMSASAQKTMLFYVANVMEILPFDAENETDQREFMHPEELMTVYGGGKPELASQIIAAGLNRRSADITA